MKRDIISDALRFAARKHAGQVRKTDPDVPYISHPVAVGFILRDAGYPDEVVIAGILHDTVEDTATSIKEIRDAFGARVAELVQAVSEDKTLSWEERKTRYLQTVLNSSADAKAIATADKLNNAQGILEHLERGDKDVWSVFSRGPQQVVMTYRHFVNEVRQGWESPLLDQLDLAVKELESHI
jgi:(p)ppGpp synthase/HD superfamily hydrolase